MISLKAISSTILLTATFSMTSSNALAANYCAAIRGNGELMPAHWGAMSSLVEEKGLPSAMAGGSSASITIFLLESLSLNPLPKTMLEQGLLIKSFQGYFESLSQTPEGLALQSLFADKEVFESIIATAPNLEEALKSPANKSLLQKHLANLLTLTQSNDMKELINPDFILYVSKTIDLMKKNDPALSNIVNYRSGQILYSIKYFGKFDANTDKTLFVRPGLIHFKKLAELIGNMGDFYANYNMDSENGKKIQELMQQFLNLCSPLSKGLSWREINNKQPLCRQLLGNAVLRYQSSNTKTNSRAAEAVGSHIPTFPTTSVLGGEAVDQFTKLYVDYQTNTNPNFGDFSVNPNDLRFGYWGQLQDLAKIESQFQSNSEYTHDAKSQKFLPLGPSPWSQVLTTSPAEPGLSRIVALTQNQLSAGGWSDLHPVMVLKAYGCNDIIYVTRKGDESVFAQGVFRRLTNSSEETLNEFYSMNNSQSSIMLSQKNASAIKCTNWNSFRVTSELNALVEEAMHAALIPPPYCK